VGVGLATIYGLMMGVVRRRSGGLLAPWIAHVLTDVVIAGIVLTFERPSVTALATAAAWWVTSFPPHVSPEIDERQQHSSIHSQVGTPTVTDD
jgi:hypothetical protein